MSMLQSDINQEDISQLAETINESINNSLTKPRLLSTLKVFLECSLQFSDFSSPNSRFILISFLDKITRQQEKLMIEKKYIDKDELTQAAERFGNKAQSAFETDLD